MRVPWWVCGLLAGPLAVSLEYLSRSTPTLGRFLVVAIPLVLVLQTLLYHHFHDARSWLLGWLIFSLTTHACRLTSAWWVAGEPFGWQVPVGIAGLLASTWLVKQGLP